jgi:acetyl esterase
MVSFCNKIDEKSAYSNANESEVELDERMTDEARNYSMCLNRFYRNARAYDLVGFRRLIALNDEDIFKNYKFDGLDISEHLIKSMIDDYDIPVSAYVPKIKSPNTQIVIFFHGGGFQFFTRKTYHRTIGHIAQATNTIWLSVEFRLAPEYKYPYAIRDSCSVTQWALDNGQKIFNLDSEAKVGLCGSSSGGNLAALVSNSFKSKLAFQILVTPSLDLSLTSDSYRRFNKSCFGLDLQTLTVLVKDYLPDDIDVKSPNVSPMFITNFEDTPRTLIVSAELDPTVDDNCKYFDKLQNASIKSQHVILKGTVCGFFDSSDVYMKTFYQAVDQVAMFLKK